MLEQSHRKQLLGRRVRIGALLVLLGLIAIACTRPLDVASMRFSTPDAAATHVRQTADALDVEAQLLLVTPNPFAAMDRLSEAIALQPDVAQYYFHSGMARFYLRSYEAAIGYFKTAIEIDPDFTLAYQYWAEVVPMLDNEDLALENYEELLELGFCTTSIMDGLNQIYQRRGQPQDAADHESCQGVDTSN
jgi:tetratricopeptide (TPR) repeat protein